MVGFPRYVLSADIGAVERSPQLMTVEVTLNDHQESSKRLTASKRFFESGLTPPSRPSWLSGSCTDGPR